MNSTVLQTPAAPVVPVVPVSRWIWPGLLILGPASVVVACIITLAHPVDPDRDVRFVVPASAKGTYELTLKAPLAERRRVVVTDSPARSWRVEALLVPPKK